MLYNTNTITTYTGQEITESYILPKTFSSIIEKHTVQLQPFSFLSIQDGLSSDWRKLRIQTPDVAEGIHEYPYDPMSDSEPDFDKLQTYWYTVEQLRLELLEKNQTWDETKLVNLVPHGNLIAE